MQCSMFTSRKKRHHYHPLPFPKPKLLWKCYQKRKKQERLRSRMKRIRSDMNEISEEQKEIRERQRQERVNFEAIELECEELKNQTILLIAQQIATTQIRLALMLQILKARENLEFDKAVMLTNALRYFSSPSIIITA
ncbi:hypothetical protein J1N35_004516 [Gossypium stocksii]|uniref:Uncharacterized protein n=1 Tax=Gossypium stocksii TaxID=47602 RepID=A0A9D4AIE7_9ROSI|nr:hypothetical protein J1N35_004516 [Gossypium stocksii]